MEWIKSFFGDLGITDFMRPTVGIFDLLDILIVAYVIYKIVFWIKETRAWALFKGILVIFVFAAVAAVLHLNTIMWILTNTISVGIIAVIVVFQPELRKALEELGKGKAFLFFSNLAKVDTEENNQKIANRTIEEILKAADKMAAVKTGALILLEQDVPLGDLERTGIPIDAIVSSQLLINIFEHNTPLHDGAVIIRNNRVAAATCFLPLTESNDISMELGTRHRAAIGASEVSDAYVIVVSEETGAISMAQGGTLYRDVTVDSLKKNAFWFEKIYQKKIGIMERKANKMKKLREKIMKDIGWKLLSLIIAIALWFMVINIEHPVTTRIYTQTITMENIDALTQQGLTILNKGQLENMKVSAKVKAQRTALDRLTQYRNSIRAVVDFSKLESVKSGDTASLEVSFLLPDSAGTGFEIVSQSPEKAEIMIEKLAAKRIPINVHINGEAGNGYTTLQPQISPSSVQISGAASVVNRVKTVQVNVELQQASEDIVVTAEPIAYDENGKQVEGITMDISKVHISIGIQKNKMVNLTASTVGIPEEGYEISEIRWSPQAVNIAGSEAILNNLQSITLPALDVTGARQTVIESFLLNEILPDGVMLSNDTPLEAEVSVVIQQQEDQQITVQSANVTLQGAEEENYDYTFSEESVSLQLTGSARELSAITTGSIAVTANVENLIEGEHSVVLEIELPEGVSLVGEVPSIMVTIQQKQQQPDISQQQPEQNENETNTDIDTEIEQTPISEE